MRKQILGLSVVGGLLAISISAFAQNPPVIPGSAESVGLTRIVPDTLVWFSLSKSIPQLNGYTDPADQATVGSSVEATAGVLGDSTFLLAAITQATNDSSKMSFTTVLIPAAGGTPKLDNAFYDDSGKIYLQDINLSRQTGNPGRIGGDPRYGAVNYGGAGEVSLYAYPTYFNSDGRFDIAGPLWGAASAVSARSYCVQLHKLDPINLLSTPLMKAVDNEVGRCCTNEAYPSGAQDFGRDGAYPCGLDNGNFVVVGEDRSGFGNPDGPNSGRAPHATIYAPDGKIVKEWSVPSTNNAGAQAGGSMWNNVGAYRGGFCVKPEGGIIYFYNNAGDLQGTVDVNVSAGVNFDVGRSDGTRLCSDIRSHYVFMAGKSPESAGFTNIMLCAWDAKTMLWITNAIVSDGNQDTTDLGGTRYLDRCNLACDAYDRVAVSWRLKPDTVAFPNQQCVARVMAFDGTKFTALTPEFYPFIQHDSDASSQAGFMNEGPAVAMTSRQILFYAKGIWNMNANPSNPPVTLANTHCYTVLSHPAPIAAPRPTMTITYGSPNSTISWQADAGLFVLQATDALEPASWSDVTPQPAITRTAYVDPTDQCQMSVPNGTSPKFYRLIRRW
jgi:hypothetical protein